MNDNRLTEVLNDCADRLSRGETLQDCLRAYPAYADELRVLLTLAKLPQRVHAAPAEVSAARRRVSAHIETLLDDFAVSKTPPRIVPLRVLTWAAVLLLALAGVVTLLFAPRDSSTQQTTEIELTVTRMTSVPATATTAATPAASATATATTAATPAASATATATTAATPAASATAADISTSTSTVCNAQAPEGWVSYHVQPGDTLSALALAGEVSLEMLLRVNCLQRGDFLIAGQIIYVPAGVDTNSTVPIEVTAEDNEDGGGENEDDRRNGDETNENEDEDEDDSEDDSEDDEN